MLGIVIMTFFMGLLITGLLTFLCATLKSWGWHARLPLAYIHTCTYIVKEFSSADVLHDHEDVRWRGDDLIQLDDVRVTK